ncbi:molybdopterin molybdotransferase MoeA [Litorimonas sp. WD9-15]|uniref:molybdopterin molybdotransferase MoeA n=1 Tax=Litorimonas sp. WD9-15 TaxID=3418716 RepID=UPI003D02438C
MISVEQALSILRKHAPQRGSENVNLGEAYHRILALDIVAQQDMPRFPASNMDGYAIRDGGKGEVLSVIGESAAGHGFTGRLETGQAVRIFTGAVIPEGADRVVLQENVTPTGESIRLKRAVKPGTHIRTVGSDFRSGEILLAAGRCLSAGDLALAAASGCEHLSVRTNPRIAILETGDELQRPGENLKNGGVTAANGFALAAQLEAWGAQIELQQIKPDRKTDIDSFIEDTKTCDIIVTIGGASVGDFDISGQTFLEAGFEMKFESVAVKPGKPCWFATRGKQVVLGLPGNPASAFVCAHLFLKPLLGLENKYIAVSLCEKVEENGPRETYLRALLSVKDAQIFATPLIHQESYRLRPQSDADALIKVPPMGGPYKAGDTIDVLPISDGPAFW